MTLVLRNGVELSDSECAALDAIIDRLDAAHVSLYRTSEGLRALVIDAGGGYHTGVVVEHVT